jgi:3-oxoadipate enol-lactonase
LSGDPLPQPSQTAPDNQTGGRFEISERPATFETSSKPRDVDAAPVAWREAGAGPLVLFLGGLGTTRTGFEPQLAALAAHYRCVAWDMPGYGASPLPGQGLSFPLLADAVAGLMDALGERQAHLAGLSMGGQIALHTALRHPGRVRSLALLDTSPAFGLDGTDPEAWKRLRLDALDAGETPASFAEPVLRSIMAPGVGAAAVAAAVASMARISASGLRAAVECIPTHDVRARLAEIGAPALVLVGEHDEETPLSYAEALAAGIPGAVLRVIPGAGHISNLEAPEAVNAALAAHLDALEAAA